MFFFEQAEFERLLGHDLLQRAGFLAERLDLVAGGRAGCVTRQAALTGFQELLGPGVIQALGDGFAATKGGDAFLAAEPSQDDADLVLGGMVLARGTTNIADQFFGWYPRGWDGGFLAHLHSPWGYDEPEILRYSNRQFGPIGADAGQPQSAACLLHPFHGKRLQQRWQCHPLWLPSVQDRFDHF
jgi:hypothetical protein